MALRTVIFYFSQSGNTKKYAEKIAEGLSQGEHTCDLVRFKKLKDDLEIIQKFDFTKYDLIGFGIPVYYFKPPFHILDILKALPLLENKRAFLFCSSGGNPGATLHKMKKITDKKGLKVIEANDQFIGLDKHPLYRDFDNTLPPSVGHPDEADLDSARLYGTQLLEKALDPESPEVSGLRIKDSEFAKITTFQGVNSQFPKFNLNEEKCSQCGLCAETCPVDAIVLDPFPKWIKKCNRCYICEMWCPEAAIECAWTWQADFMTELMKKKGYVPKKRKK